MQPNYMHVILPIQDKFKELYEAAERKTSIRKKSFAIELLVLQERKDTGRIYLMNVDSTHTWSIYRRRSTN